MPTFNPEDFQFERILPPEENKPILEWDALHRLMLVRTKDDNGEYTYQSTRLSSQVNKNLHDHLPDEWSHENDRIVSFSLYENGEYLLEKEKLKFDFNTKKSRWVRYEYTDLSMTQVIEFFNIIKSAIEVNRLQSEIARTKAVIDVTTTFKFLEQTEEQKKRNITQLLRKSDWTQLSDAPEVFNGEKDLWTTYRTWLRDNVKYPSDFEDPLDFLIYEEEFGWPIDPYKYHENDPEHSVEYLSSPDHFVNTPEDGGIFAVEALMGDIKLAALYERRRQEEGIAIQKEIWDKISQYRLNDGIDEVTVQNLKIVEE